MRYSDLRDAWHAAGGQPGREIGVRLWESIRGELHDGSRTMEFGSGLSTWLFAAAASDHLAIETSPRWFRIVADSTHCGAADVRHTRDWSSFRDGRFDLILVDGPAGDRFAAVDAVPELIAPRGVVFVDDVHRRRDAEVARGIARILHWEYCEFPSDTGGPRRFATIRPAVPK